MGAYVSLSYLQCTIYDKQALLKLHLSFFPRNTTRSGSAPPMVANRVSRSDLDGMTPIGWTIIKLTVGPCWDLAVAYQVFPWWRQHLHTYTT
jgi:hypothetical protein